MGFPHSFVVFSGGNGRDVVGIRVAFRYFRQVVGTAVRKSEERIQFVVKLFCFSGLFSFEKPLGLNFEELF